MSYNVFFPIWSNTKFKWWWLKQLGLYLNSVHLSRHQNRRHKVTNGCRGTWTALSKPSENRKFQRRAGRDLLSSGLQSCLTLCCAYKDTWNRHKAEWQRERRGNKKEGYRAGVCEGLKEEEDTRIDKSTERWLKKKKNRKADNEFGWYCRLWWLYQKSTTVSPQAQACTFLAEKIPQRCLKSVLCCEHTGNHWLSWHACVISVIPWT